MSPPRINSKITKGKKRIITTNKWADGRTNYAAQWAHSLNKNGDHQRFLVKDYSYHILTRRTKQLTAEVLHSKPTELLKLEGHFLTFKAAYFQNHKITLKTWKLHFIIPVQ